MESTFSLITFFIYSFLLLVPLWRIFCRLGFKPYWALMVLCIPIGYYFLPIVLGFFRPGGGVPASKDKA